MRAVLYNDEQTFFKFLLARKTHVSEGHSGARRTRGLFGKKASGKGKGRK